MKALYLVGAVILTVLVLIIVFQNVAFPAFFIFFFAQVSASLAGPFLLIALIGAGAGMLYTLAFRSMIDATHAEEEETAASKF